MESLLLVEEEIPIHAHEMISTHPHVKGSTNDVLIRCIEECFDCAQTCTSCADACLGEGMVAELTQCIRRNMDCADICMATGTVATRRTGSNEEVIRRMLAACMDACRTCGEECERHAGMHEHCRICAEACRRCEQACRQAMDSMSA
uniref:four-helix bundle copper-binding protein n=1 Tax=Microvirga roseola TaxID=2883126 RepID=UPI0038991ECB